MSDALDVVALRAMLDDQNTPVVDLDAIVGRCLDEIERLRTNLEAMTDRASKAELRTLSLYTPLWEWGYDCNDYDAQEIVRLALQERSQLGRDVTELRAQLATARANLERAWKAGLLWAREPYTGQTDGERMVADLDAIAIARDADLAALDATLTSHRADGGERE